MNLEKELHRLKKVDPPAKFRRLAKSRLMHQIQIHENESWLIKLLSKFRPVQPSQKWVNMSKMRLMNRIATPEKVVGFLAWTKRVLASALVMTVSVTTVLFSVGGKQPVKASDNAYLEVTSGRAEVKHPDRVEWEPITESLELMAGDLVRLGDTSSAVIHFFDDSQLRLSENSLLLLSRIETSPGFSQQGIVETSLHKGRVWLQTLNVNDNFSHFSIATRDALVSTSNGSLDIASDLFGDTTIRVFKRYADVSALSAETREIIVTGRLNTLETLNLSDNNDQDSINELAALANIEDISAEERAESWVAHNLEQDQQHLASLKDREWIRLQAATGTVPGDLLYPVKRAKERLSLALSDATDAQINIANQRLSEAILLIQQGDTDSAKKALAEYQDWVRQLADSQKGSEVRQRLSNQVIVSNQKALIAALPGDAKINLVKQALDETEELLAESPIELAEVRLQNALENMAHIQEYVANGDLQAAQDTLVSHDLTLFDVLDTAEAIEDEEVKKAFYTQVLETQYAQQRLLNEIQDSVKDDQSNETLAKLIENADQKLNAGIETTVAAVKPILPDVILAASTPISVNEKVQAFVDKINIYRTRTGQSNQLSRLLRQNPQQARDLEFLIDVRDQLDGQARTVVDFEIEQLRADLAVQKSKEIKARIDRAKRLGR